LCYIADRERKGGGCDHYRSTPGRGSTFSFTLPVTVEEQARPA
jgi:hypothetical protein